MRRFHTAESWDEEDETRTIEMRSGSRPSRESVTQIEVHPSFASEPAMSDPEWEKPTTTFVGPGFTASPTPHAGSATDWIGPHQRSRHPSQPPSPNAFDGYAMAPQHEALAQRVYQQAPQGTPTQQYVPAPDYSAPPPPVQAYPQALPPHFEPAPPANCYYEPPPVELSQGVLQAVESGAHRPSFTPAPITQRPIGEISRPKMRPRMESVTGTGTWKKTIPALRRMVGLPVVAGFEPRPRPPSFPSDPPASVTDVEARRFSWPPAVLIGMAVGLVAMVVLSIVGLGTRAADAARAARERVVTASATAGDALTRATVFVDGAQRCEALPCELTLADGSHWITVRADGFDTPPSRNVTVGAEEPKEIHFDLVMSAPVAAPIAIEPIAPVGVPPAPATSEPDDSTAPKGSAERATARTSGIAKAPTAAAQQTARLNINAIPFASVVLDGKPVGQTPRLNLKVKPGPHTIVFVTPDGRRAVRGTSVAAGESATVSAKL